MATEGTKKLHLYVDETGQETRGAFFLVSVVISPAQHVEFLREQLVKLERVSKKSKHRWVRTTPKQRATYLEGLTSILAHIGPIYWRQYADGTNYVQRTAEAIVAAIRQRDPSSEMELVVTVDGYNWQELQVISRVFRECGIQRRKLRGGRDESEPLLRLADALAGFLRDVIEQREDASKAWQELESFCRAV